MRVIDAKGLEKQTKESFKENPVVMGLFLRWIRKQPTIDAVPVVCCRECEHYISHAYACSKEYMNGVKKPEDFCSYGERRADHATN